VEGIITYPEERVQETVTNAGATANNGMCYRQFGTQATAYFMNVDFRFIPHNTGLTLQDRTGP
jgi:hypothetical protein